MMLVKQITKTMGSVPIVGGILSTINSLASIFSS